VLTTAIIYVVLPEMSIAWVDRLGPARAVELMFWLVVGIVALSLVLLLALLLGGICLLMKKLNYWLAYSHVRA